MLLSLALSGIIRFYSVVLSFCHHRQHRHHRQHYINNAVICIDTIKVFIDFAESPIKCGYMVNNSLFNYKLTKQNTYNRKTIVQPLDKKRDD